MAWIIAIRAWMIATRRGDRDRQHCRTSNSALNVLVIHLSEDGK